MDPLIPILFLACIATGLLGAAAYAVFGRPSSRAGKRRKKQVVNGFRLAGGALLGMFLMTGFVWGTAIAFGRVHAGGVSPPAAAVLAAAAFLAIALTAQRWAKYFVGFVVFGVLNSLTMAATGHFLNKPSMPVSRAVSLTVAAVYLLTVLSTMRFAGGIRLTMLDKAALLWWLLAFTGAVLFPDAMIPMMTVGVIPLALTWWLSRSKPTSYREHPRR